MKRVALTLSVLWVVGCGGGGGGGTDGDGDGGTIKVDPNKPLVDLVVDTNRNGVLEPGLAAEDTGEDAWSTTGGAIMLANVDDDDLDKKVDATDEKVNGADDLLDLARIQIRAWPKAPEGTVGIVAVDPSVQTRVRVYRMPPAPTTSIEGQPAALPTVVGALGLALTTADIQAGVELGIEAKTFATASFDGNVPLSYVMTDAMGVELGSDTAQLRVAPAFLSSNVDPTSLSYVANLRDGESTAFQNSLRPGVEAAGAQLIAIDSTRREYLSRFGSPDQWTQDHWETGYTFMPGPSGTVHSMHLVMRAATEPRQAADYAQLELLGKDYGWIHPVASTDPQTHDVSMDSTGNLDAIPAYTNGTQKWPFGRVLIGSGQYRQPDQGVVSFWEAQKAQGVVKINTEWLTVGHVDEVVSFAKANTPRGWKMFIASPRLAREMLTSAVQAEATAGNVQLFQQKAWIDWQSNREIPAAIAINAILNDADLMAENQEAQLWIDEIRQILQTEIGLEDSEIVEMPFLMRGENFSDGAGGSVTLYVAYIPGTVNQLVINDHAVMPDPFGPVLGGQDLFKRDLAARYAAIGLVPHYADAWDLYHRLSGEVHCATNATRDIPTTLKWWENAL